MCLAIPGKIVAIKHDMAGLQAQVDYSGVLRSISLEFTPEAQVGEFVLVHAGFAIAVLNEHEAQATLAEFSQEKQNGTEQSPS